ncbi:ABC transporter permease [Clostridium pasteurianum]|uniref:ABC-type Fe3+ transport system, permease component n=1 Tax=Clostridium pasteurianum BC1 TaxID=86416 RepID=R4K9G2_CLOPA|nr:ABC transporter permease subunit [Clostridium pasteurianum]AGK96280.1 ABC-type Fe3+ transport system, permease component [Clostridium pasteurianum BC1]
MKKILRSGSMIISSNKKLFVRFGEKFGEVFGIIAMTVIVVYPLAALLLQSIFPHIFDKISSITPSLANLLSVFTDKSNFLALSNSIIIGLLAAVIAVILGTFSSIAIHHMPDAAANIFNSLIWIAFFMPSYVIAEGWMLLMQDGGILSQIFGLPFGWSAWFFTRYGLALIMGLRFFTYVYFSMHQALKNIGTELLNAGKIGGATRSQLFFKVTLPLLTPALLAGASIAFAEGFGDFGIAAAITPNSHIPLLTYQIYSSLNQDPVNYSVAASLSVIEVLVTSAAIGLQFMIMRKKSYVTTPSFKKTDNSSEKYGNKCRYYSIFFVGMVIIIILSFVLPLMSNICASLWKVWSNGINSSNWTFAHYRDAIQINGDGYASLLRSITYSAIVAIVAVPFAVILAYQLIFKHSLTSKFLNILNMSTLAIPGVVLAAGFVFAWNAVWLIPLNLVLYGTPICLAMAYLAGALPYSIRLQTGALSTLPPNLLKSAKAFGANNMQIIFKIIVPLVSTTTISTFFMSFAGIMFELPAASLLYPPGQPPFSVVVQSRFNSSDWSNGSALTIIGILIVFLVFLLTRSVIWFMGHTKLHLSAEKIIDTTNVTSESNPVQTVEDIKEF